MLYQATNSVVGHYLLQYLCEMVLIHPHWKKRTGTNWKMHPPSLPHHRSSKDDVRRRFSLQGVVQCKMLPGFGRKSSTICLKRFISVCHALTVHQQPRHWKCTKLHPPGAATLRHELGFTQGLVAGSVSAAGAGAVAGDATGVAAGVAGAVAGAATGAATGTVAGAVGDATGAAAGAVTGVIGETTVGGAVGSLSLSNPMTKHERRSTIFTR